nr:ribonuclease H-like domain-containing protein [Tanacetum cinerariifolium]
MTPDFPPSYTFLDTTILNQPPTEPPRTYHMVTRSQSGIVKPIDRLSLHTTSISSLPKSLFLALQNPHWNNAIHDEYNVLVKNGTWILVPRPVGINLVRSIWLFKHNIHADGTLSHYKARLVANGSSQQLGIDCDETFNPVVKPATIRTVLSLAVSRKWPIHQSDVKNAFLNGNLSKTAPRAWFQRFTGYATRVEVYHSRCDSSLFILRQGSQQVITSLHNEFDMTDLGALNYFLGISATRHSTGLFLSQKQYAIELLAHAHMTNCNPSRTPTISRSNVEAEYRGVANVVDETTRLRNLLRELHSPLSAATLVYCDNVSATYVSANPIQHQRTKHIEIGIHFVRDLVTAGQVRVLHVPSRYQYADIFTKGLRSALFEDFRSSLSVRLLPARTAGAY